MPKIIGTRPDDSKIYQISGSPLAVVEFPVQPGVGSLGVAIWGGPSNTIWAHNGKPNPTGTPKYLFFTGAVWVEHACPAVADPPRSMHGSADGSIVYAGGVGYIHKYTSSSGVWSSVKTGVDAGTIWCDETGQYVWATPSSISGGNNIWYSDDYGATWTDVFSQMLADLDTYWSAPFYDVPFSTVYSIYLGPVWGFSKNEVYTTIGYKWTPFLTYTGCSIIQFDGTKWFEVGQRVAGYGFRTYDYGSGAYARMGFTPGIWKDGDRFITTGLQGGGVALEVYRTFEDSNWGTTPLAIINGYTVPKGRNVIGLNGTIAVAADYSGGNSKVFLSDDRFDTWDDMVLPWSGVNGLECLTIFGIGADEIQSISGGPVTERGGHVLVATGTFPIGQPMSVTIDGVPCYGGQGNGYSPVSLDGQTLSFVSPPLTKGLNRQIEIISGPIPILGFIDVVERSWASIEHESRRLYPPWIVGKRRLAEEDLV